MDVLKKILELVYKYYYKIERRNLMFWKICVLIYFVSQPNICRLSWNNSCLSICRRNSVGKPLSQLQFEVVFRARWQWKFRRWCRPLWTWRQLAAALLLLREIMNTLPWRKITSSLWNLWPEARGACINCSPDRIDLLWQNLWLFLAT